MLYEMPETWETRVQSLGREDPLEKGMAAHSSILARKTPWTEEPGGLQPRGSQRVGHDFTSLLLHEMLFVAAGKLAGRIRRAGFPCFSAEEATHPGAQPRVAPVRPSPVNLARFTSPATPLLRRLFLPPLASCQQISQ